MKDRTAKKTRRISKRTAKGQAIVEGTVMLAVLIGFVAVILFLLANTSLMSSYNYRINAVAAEGARQYVAGMWWLGMKRPFFQTDLAKVDVDKLAKAEIAQMGLLNAEVVGDVKVKTHRQKVKDKEITIVQVDFDVKGLEILTAGIFPKEVTMHASGIATDAEYAVEKHGMALLHTSYPDPLNPQVNIERAIRVPVYNATVGYNTPASNDPRWLRAGDSIGHYPVVELTLYCPSSGNLQMQRTPAENTTEILERKPWTPYNGAR
jgi:hypothetical protein